MEKELIKKIRIEKEKKIVEMKIIKKIWKKKRNIGLNKWRKKKVEWKKKIIGKMVELRKRILRKKREERDDGMEIKEWNKKRWGRRRKMNKWGKKVILGMIKGKKERRFNGWVKEIEERILSKEKYIVSLKREKWRNIERIKDERVEEKKVWEKNKKRIIGWRSEINRKKNVKLNGWKDES